MPQGSDPRRPNPDGYTQGITRQKLVRLDWLDFAAAGHPVDYASDADHFTRLVLKRERMAQLPCGVTDHVPEIEVPIGVVAEFYCGRTGLLGWFSRTRLRRCRCTADLRCQQYLHYERR